MTNESGTATTPYNESPTSGRRWGWAADVTRGRVSLADLTPTTPATWYDEDIRAVMNQARSRPGDPLVVSVHPTPGAAGSARATRQGDPRIDHEAFTVSTRTMADPDHPRATGVVLTYTGGDDV